MAPLDPHTRHLLLTADPTAEADLNEYEQLLSQRFTRDPDAVREPSAALAEEAASKRLTYLYNRLYKRAEAPTPTGTQQARTLRDTFPESLSDYRSDAKNTLVVENQTRGFIVYLDGVKDIWWDTTHAHWEALLRSMGASNQEAVDRFWVKFALLSDRPILYLPDEVATTFRLYVASALARVLDDMRPAGGLAMLEQAEKYIEERAQEKSRVWYLWGSGVMAAAAISLTLILWVVHYSATGYKGDPARWAGTTLFWMMLGAGCGSVGALFSVLQRVGSSPLNAAAGPRLHYVEGGIRIVVGMTGGVIVALAIRAGLIGLPATGETQILRAMCVLCMIAGTSERLVNTYIARISETTTPGGAAPAPAPGSAVPQKNA